MEKSVRKLTRTSIELLMMLLLTFLLSIYASCLTSEICLPRILVSLLVFFLGISMEPFDIFV